MIRKRINHVATCKGKSITHYESIEEIIQIKKKAEFFKTYDECNGDRELIRFSIQIKKELEIFKKTRS